MRFLSAFVLVGLLVGRVVAVDEPAMRVEHSKPLPRGGNLGTQRYAPTAGEKAVINDWKPPELASGSAKIEKLTGNVDQRVAWFGIVREVKENMEASKTQLVVEMKYFDGLTDMHLQIVSINGAGDFEVTIPGVGHKVKPLSLVRVYGKVAAERDGVPEVSAEFVRAWDWRQFAFMPYGKDRSNPKWVKLRKVEDELDVYTSNPTDVYYEKLLGKRLED